MKIARQEDLNFLLTNRIPRRALTRFMGWFSKIEQPLVRAVSFRVWGLFSDLDFRDAKQTGFRSVHDYFTRSLRDGARTVDPDPSVVVSPCDAIVGASGRVEDGQVLQVKGFPYRLDDLLCDPAHAAVFRNGSYVTLRLTAGMYHRFHAPYDCRVTSVSHVPGDVWNVNPVALKRIERLFCRNERAVIRTTMIASGHALTLVPVAAILVSGIRLRFLDLPRGSGPRTFACDAVFGKGEEMGWFEHGSTIILLASEAFRLREDALDGATIRAGQGLLLRR
jgi:phosphatidylserine decarboxylase